MRIGYFEHWCRPTWSFIEFLKAEGYDIEKIDYSKRGYLENYDIALVEQNGFNDFIENDELYIREWVARGGIIFFMHQDYERWAPYFLPHELGHTMLIHRYVSTISSCDEIKRPYKCYMMPWMEEKSLFNYPEKITHDELIDWNIQVNSFRIVKENNAPVEKVATAALSCFVANGNWEVLGSYMDPMVKDGALVLQAKYGKGLYFLNQILVPEVLDDGAERCLAFWKKYMRNLMAHFENFKNGITPPEVKTPEFPADKRNYKLTVHMHSLDWYGADSAPGTINAMMRYMGFDICSFALKDAAPYDGKLDPAKYSDDKVLFLDGQEYHPFNWGDRHDAVSHNCYHMLAVGIDHDAYTQEFTRSLFGDGEVAEYLPKALNYIHEHHGVAIATHPWNLDYWFDLPFDAVDQEPLKTWQGTEMERFWLTGRKMASMVSVDLFGFQRIVDYPAVNFIYLNGEKPCRDSVTKAIRNGHTISALSFNEADITLNGAIPGDEISGTEKLLHVTAETRKEKITGIRVYADDKVIYSQNPDAQSVDMDITLPDYEAKHFIRVELFGETEITALNTTPYYIKK